MLADRLADRIEDIIDELDGVISAIHADADQVEQSIGDAEILSSIAGAHLRAAQQLINAAAHESRVSRIVP